MSHSAKRQYLLAIIERYQKSSKKEKKFVLDEFCAVCGYSRKYAIRLLNSPLQLRNEKPGKKPEYGPDVVRHLVALWHAMGRICSKKMKKAVPEWLKYYQCPELSDDIKTQLQKISPSTIDRLLEPNRTKRGRSCTRSSKWFKARIPIQAEDGHIDKPGFIVADTVAHCGDAIAGSYAHSLTVTDLATTWTLNEALWCKNREQVCVAMNNVENSLPFPISAFKSDSGTEFINRDFFAYFVQRDNPVQFYRSRPYQKNDNCHVEQKNLTHVRRLFGYDRIDDPEIVQLMNEIYRNYWNPLQNFFIPTMKLARKERVGAKIKKYFDEPQTPFERVLNSKHITAEQKEKLKQVKEKLNPFDLRMALDIKLKEFNDKVRKLNNLSKVA